MIIRALTLPDVPACLSVVADCWDRKTAQRAQPDFTEPFNGGAWRPFFYVAEEEGHVVGTAGHRASWFDYNIHVLSWVAVRGDKRGRGYGRSLVDRCLRDLAPIATTVILTTSEPDFYERCWGFQTISRPAKLMALTLTLNDAAAAFDAGDVPH